MRAPGASLIAILVAGCTGAGESTAEPPGAVDRARYADRPIGVDRVIDGDTAVLEDGTTVRYVGIDAPEAAPPAQCGAAAATAANESWVGDEVVTLRLDPAETRDRYGRLLAYLEKEGEIVNVALVRAGRACAFPFGATRLHRDEIAAAEREAREAGRGVWGECPPVPNGCPPGE